MRKFKSSFYHAATRTLVLSYSGDHKVVIRDVGAEQAARLAARAAAEEQRGAPNGFSLHRES